MAMYWGTDDKGIGDAGKMAQRVRTARGEIRSAADVRRTAREGSIPSRVPSFLGGVIVGWVAMGAWSMYCALTAAGISW